jgi:hypothetical protein
MIVEGHGEVTALPILVRRIARAEGLVEPECPAPLRDPRGKLVKQDELHRAVELMARKAAPSGPLLVVLDADDDCPAKLGPQLVEWVRAARADRACGVVMCQRELEAWFLAAARSLRGTRGLPMDLEPPPSPESLRDAKGWLSARMPGGYSETVDQPALAATMSLDEARATASFDKLWRDLVRILPVTVPTGT